MRATHTSFRPDPTQTRATLHAIHDPQVASTQVRAESVRLYALQMRS